ALLLNQNFRRRIVPSLKNAWASLWNKKLVVVYCLVLIAATTSTIVAWIIGLWDTSLLKDTVILTATVAFPLTFRSFAVKTGRQLAVSVVYDTMGFTTFVVLYLDSAPFPLLGEIAIQTTVSLLALVL